MITVVTDCLYHWLDPRYYNTLAESESRIKPPLEGDDSVSRAANDSSLESFGFISFFRTSAPIAYAVCLPRPVSTQTLRDMQSDSLYSVALDLPMLVL
ncbi:hypothetical protein ACEPAI_7231 [Sanghuangporus weigelae]